MNLKVNDKVRIIGVPGENIPNYVIHSSTKRAYKKLIARKRPLRINRVDEFGQPWYNFKFQLKNGAWEHHTMCIMENDNNWIKVKKRK